MAKTKANNNDVFNRDAHFVVKLMRQGYSETEIRNLGKFVLFDSYINELINKAHNILKKQDWKDAER